MSFASEFKEFAMKGNVVDLAVGVIIGAAFGKIVDSIVGDLIMPIVGRIFGGLDFSATTSPLAGQPTGMPLRRGARRPGAVFAYGNFITVAINFVILAFIIFLMVKQINRLKRGRRRRPGRPPEDMVLLREIRDSLKNVSDRRRSSRRRGAVWPHTCRRADQSDRAAPCCGRSVLRDARTLPSCRPPCDGERVLAHVKATAHGVAERVASRRSAPGRSRPAASSSATCCWRRRSTCAARSNTFH